MAFSCKKKFLWICLVLRKVVRIVSSSSSSSPPLSSATKNHHNSGTRPPPPSTTTNTMTKPKRRDNRSSFIAKYKDKDNKDTHHHLGQIYTNREAANAFRKNKLNSKLNASLQRIRLVFLNETDETLILCWVHENGNLRHYYKLKPCGSPVLTCLDHRHGFQLKTCNSHLEHAFLGHAFVLGTARCSDDDTDVNANAKNVKGKCDDDNNNNKDQIGDIIAGYRPLRVSLSQNVQDAGLCVHVIRITKRAKSNGITTMLRRRMKKKRDATTKAIYDLVVEQYEMDKTPLDTSKKVYDEVILGGGWKCMVEHGLFDEDDNDDDDEQKKDNDDASLDSTILCKVRKQLEIDLEACSRKLPPKACKLLQESVPFWINKMQQYGPKCAPIVGRGMCFHVHPNWLSRNGMSTEKCGGVEIYQATKYLDDHGLWYGTGGGLLHELSHAWHNKFVPDGYCNGDIIDCYEAAMKDKLYDCVKVHNRRGGIDQCRGYAATNAEEYFAELSVAFLGGVGEDEDLEFNKWYPFNRNQLKDHDPRAYKMLHKVWGVPEEEESE